MLQLLCSHFVLMTVFCLLFVSVMLEAKRSSFCHVLPVALIYLPYVSSL